MASSTKAKVYEILHCRQRTTEPRPLENLVKFGGAVLEICERRDRQTGRQTNIDKLIELLWTPTRGESNIPWCLTIPLDYSYTHFFFCSPLWRSQCLWADAYGNADCIMYCVHAYTCSVHKIV